MTVETLGATQQSARTMDYGTDEFFQFHYDRELLELRRFWSRFPHRPDFAGASVLDFGCDLGAHVFTACEEGATRVVGVDIAADQIDWASRHKARLTSFPGYAKLECCDVRDLDESGFDYILSKDVFEHVCGGGGG